MSDGGNVVPRITKAEHIGPNDTGDNIEAKRSANYIWDGSGWIRQTPAASGGSTEYVDGSVATANPVGGIPVFNDGGTIRAVSAAHPLPTTATITGGGDASAANQVTGNASLSSIDSKITTVNTGAVVVSSSALPTGAATAAKQPALGVAGTPSTDVITVQGKPGMTALVTDSSATTQPVSATSLPLPAGASTATKQDTGNTSLASIDGKITVVNTGAVVVSSSALPSGAATSAKQPAIGSAGTPSSDVLTVQGKTGMTALTVDGSGVTQPISGTITANAGTNLNTSALATSANITGGAQKTQVVDGSGNVIGATSNALDVNIKSGASSGTQYAESTTAATATGTVAMGKNGSTVKAVTVDSSGNLNVNVAAGATSGTQYADGAARGTATGTLLMLDDGTNIQSVAGTTAGTLKVDLSATAANATAIKVDNSAVTQPVSGTFWPATQPVSGTVTANAGTGTMAVSAAALPLPSGASTAAKQPALGTAGTASSDVLTVQGIAAMTALKVDGSAVTQPVSGTFWQTTQPVSAASLPLPTGAAQDSTLTGGTQRSKITDGTNNAAVKAASTAAVAADPALVVAISPNNTVPVSLATAPTTPVTGTFWQATQPVSAASLPLPSGAATSAKQPALGTAGTASSDVLTVQGIASMTALKVDGSAVTQPVSGTFWQATQPVSLASVPSHAVTNAGTFAVQAAQSGTWNIGTVTSITNALPAGTNALGTVGTTSAAINVGQQTVSTTAVQVSTTSTVPTNGIIIRALAGNSAAIYVGGSGVTTATGFELSPGESTSFTCNLNTIYIRSVASTTDKICWNVE